MGRRKNNNNSNQSSAGFSHLPQGSKIRFADKEDEDEALKDASGSSNHDESMCDPELDKAVDDSMGEPEVSFIAADDKTSADYYFDSYSHFGSFLSPSFTGCCLRFCFGFLFGCCEN